jgi:pyridoxal biosynthesis lyase PdxS
VYKAEDKAPRQSEGVAAPHVNPSRARAVADATGAEALTAAERRRADVSLAGAPSRGAQPAAALEQLQEQELSIAQKKERIAAACTALLEAPERNVCELKVLWLSFFGARRVVTLWLTRPRLL